MSTRKKTGRGSGPAEAEYDLHAERPYDAGYEPEPNGPSEDDVPTFSEGGGIRYLHFGTEWIQGAMDITDPPRLVLEYTRQMMAWLLFLDPPRSPLGLGILGLGSASLARFCLKHTASRLRIVEWNPQVVAACHMFFKLPQSTRRIGLFLDDAAQWVADPDNHGTCSALMVDLYDAHARGPVRESLEFYSGCRKALGEAGVVAVNLFGEHASFPRNIRNLDEAFDGRVVLLPEIDAGNRIALAFSGPMLEIAAADLLDRAEVVESQYGLPARRWARALMREAGGGKKGGGVLRF